MDGKTTIRDVSLFNFARHFVIEGQQAKTTHEVARKLVGLHSARLPSAYVSLQARVDNFKAKDLRELLYSKRELIKIRCMRQTLHIAPVDVARTLHYSTLKIRLAGCLRFYKQNNVSTVVLEAIRNKTAELVYCSPVDYKVLLDKVSAFGETYITDKEFSKKIARNVIKELWERGIICYINTSKHWAHEKRHFAFTETYYPNFLQSDAETKIEQARLVRWYVENYGPVTFSDICWWSGLSKSEIKEALDSLTQTIKKVRIQDVNADFYLCEETVAELHTFRKKFCDDWVALLAYEDSTLKGYFESRFRYVKDKYYNLIFNSIGEVLPTIVINGNVSGIWRWNKKTRRMETNLFEPIAEHHKNKLRNAAERMEEFLLEDNQQMYLFD